MNPLLQQIVTSTRESVALRRRETSPSRLREQLQHARRPFSLQAALAKPGPQFIAEIKKRSPSSGPIAPDADAVSIAGQYLRAGAAAISVLTERNFFDGGLESLSRVRAAFPQARLLMKDFVLEEYQLLEGRLAGADAVLLIAGLLDQDALTRLYVFARTIGLEPLVEVHDAAEMARANALGADLIGVNNRNLRTMEVSLSVSRELISQAPARAVMISESGLRDGRTVRELHALGYRGFLVGTALMRSVLPGAALQRLREEAVCA